MTDMRLLACFDFQMVPLVDFDQIETVTLAKEERDTMQRVILHTYNNEKPVSSALYLVICSSSYGFFTANISKFDLIKDGCS